MKLAKFGLFLFAVILVVLLFDKKDIPKHYSYSADKATYGQLEKIKPRFDFSDKVYGGIVSHHLLAAIDIAGFYGSLSNQKIDTVVLIGPNHFGTGADNIAVSNYDFETPWGKVKTDREIVDDFVTGKVAKINEDVFAGEHSISTQIPYIKFYLPQAQIVPMAIKINTAKSDLLNLAMAISEINKNIIVVASVDFSHHTGKSVAVENDKKSIETIMNFDTDNLYTLNIDSPPTIFVLLNYLKSVEARKMDYWQQNAADILKNPEYDDVTSYLFALFRK